MSIIKLNLTEGESLPERVASAIRKAIVSGDLLPGTRITEANLVKQLGVSRVSLRDALRRLEHEGLVSIHPNRGTWISEQSTLELEELFAVRGIFEAYAAQHLANQKDSSAVEALEAMIDEMKECVKRGAFDTYYELAGQFHDEIVHACANTVLSRQYDLIKRQLRRYQASMSGVPESPRHSIAEHSKIVRAIASHEPSVASELARKHISGLIRRYKRNVPRA
jgi:DNA-binding GntR family transcriptional regulator